MSATLVQPARAAGRLAADLAGVAVLSQLFTAVLLAAVALAPLAAGWRPYAVLSGSMRPALPVGSVVVVAPGPGARRLSPSDVVLFADPRAPGRTITHRVTAVDAAGAAPVYTTRGDANRRPDSTPLHHRDVLGRMRLVVPLAGLPAAWVARGEAWMAGAWAALLALGVATLVLLVRPAPGPPRYVGRHREAPARSA